MKPRRRFRTGDLVRIAGRAPTGHVRTPAYVRGRLARVVCYCGAFANPESLAYGGDGLPKRDLYRVNLAQSDLWPGYSGTPGDTLEIEIYDHWLEQTRGHDDAA